MSIFIDEYMSYISKYIVAKKSDIEINNIDIDLIENFQYLENESTLHNSVEYLNNEFLKKIRPNTTLLEIGCGSNSRILNSCNRKIIRKDGLDLYEIDSNGKNNFANIIGSVSNLPLSSNQYDYCISNQSLEHWFEFNVSLKKGLYEICRVLKDETGMVILNFPLFLHGKKQFVQGDLEYIVDEISSFFKIKSISIVHSSSKQYLGWQRCRQPQYRIQRFIKSRNIKSKPYSIVCEIIGEKNYFKTSNISIKGSKLKRIFRMYFNYSFLDILLKIKNHLIRFLKN